MKATRTLYICYFGLREPLVQTQVLPYLRQLRSENLQVSLLTFEPRLDENWRPDEIAKWRNSLQAEGISWHYLKYHKRPSLPATIYDIAQGTRKILQIMRREGVSVLHARNHVPALMAAVAKKFKGSRLIFDIRGFMPEEYTDAGIWPENGFLYRGLKRVERYLLRAADGFVVLTEKAREIVFPDSENTDIRGRPIEVIPCCVDFARFDTENDTREVVRAELNVSSRRVIVYVGSFGGWYLTDEMVNFLASAHRQDPTTFSMILTQSPQQLVIDRLVELQIDRNDFLVREVTPSEIPRLLKAADIAISFIKPCYSKQASSPTKVAEYFASGLPLVCNAGIGDLDKLVSERCAGVLLSEFDEPAYLKALADIETMRRDPTLSSRLRKVAREEFDLASVGRTRYRRLYERLLQ